MEAGKILLGDESNVSNASSVRLQGDRDFGNTTKRTRDNVVVNWNRKVSLFNYEEGGLGDHPKIKGHNGPTSRGGLVEKNWGGGRSNCNYQKQKKELLLIRSEVQRTFFRPFLCICWRMRGEDDLRKWISEGSRVEKCYNEHNSAKHPPMQKYWVNW